jgi:hypothetical protein
MTVTTIVDRCTKLHHAGILVSSPYSSEFATTTTKHHAAMMSQIG